MELRLYIQVDSNEGWIVAIAKSEKDARNEMALCANYDPEEVVCSYKIEEGFCTSYFK